MFATVDLHNLMHFLKLRLHEHAQYEIRVYAEAMLQLIEPLVPVTVAGIPRALPVDAAASIVTKKRKAG
jgi:thymidylate synthase ThyX